MRITFRQRVFWVLVGTGTLPLAVALTALAWQVRSSGSAAGPRAALDEAVSSGRELIAALETAGLEPDAQTALDRHTSTIARGATMARRAEALSRVAAGALAVAVLLIAVALAGASLHLARRWSRSLSAPIDQLVTWVKRIEAGEPLPEPREPDGFSEFRALRGALREMAGELEDARHREIERERLLAFQEVARRVAHEVRGPLTSSRLALAQLEKAKPSGTEPALEVIGEEIDRLDTMAREFADFGRLPEGPVALVDIGELLDTLVPATVGAISVHHERTSDLVVSGRYEPLRRAMQNLLRNAVDASGAGGVQIIASRAETKSTVVVQIVDHGPGIDPEILDRVFEPYFTTKRGGTGLGLAIVKQTVDRHGGTITVEDTPGGGATFVVELPTAP